MKTKFGICPATSTSNSVSCIVGDLPLLPCLTLMLELAKKERIVNLQALVVTDDSDKKKLPFREWQKVVLKKNLSMGVYCVIHHLFYVEDDKFVGKINETNAIMPLRLYHTSQRLG